ncbi:dihydropteroate synthase [Corynebacterium sp. 13CS0277]|nr:dihydropteroate synthase [Corynebacterium sp. 13CS0277]
MGILNVTEDSFSDGGVHLADPVAHAERMRAEGADIIDVGGESTRPGARRVDPALEAARVLPVVEELSGRGMQVSVDTMRAEVAAAAAARGARLINDVSGGRADPEMFAVMADAGVDVCLMHWAAEQFGDAAGSAHTPVTVVDDVRRGLESSVEAALAAGVAEERIILDPGLGFAKSAECNWELLRNLDRLPDFPLLIGASRKRFLAAVRAERDLEPQPDIATAALSALLGAAGVWGVRVHDVAATVDALTVAAHLQGGQRG